MTCPSKLTDYLEKQGVPCERMEHPEAFTAQQTAQAEHVPGRMQVKVVMVKVDGVEAMTVMPSTHRLNLDQLKKLLGAQEVRLMTEQEFGKLFPDCEVGAMPPFGNLYDVPLYVDQSLSESEYVVFNAGSHHESMKISFREYERLVRPVLLTFAQAP